MKRTVELVAFLAMFLPASFLAAQEAWEFKPQLRYVAGTSATQMVFEAYIEAEATNSAAPSLYFSGATFALLFDSSLSDDALTALLETYTASETDLENNVESGGFNLVEGGAIFITILRAPSNPPAQARSCTPSSGSCEIIIGTFTIPSIVPGTTLSVAIGRYDSVSEATPATVTNPAVAEFAPQGFSGASVVITDTPLAFPPPAPTVSMSAAVTAVDESAVATIALGISPAAGSNLTLNYAIAADTDVTTADAVAADYVDANTGSIMILAGNGVANIEITATDDNLAELAEVFVVTLSSVTAADGATVVLGTGVMNTVTIAASDPPEVTLAGPAEELRGNTATYTVNLSTEPTADVVMTYAITGTATAGTHYGDPASGTATVDTGASTVTIPSGSTSGTFAIMTTIAGAGNDITVTLSSPTGGGGETPTLGVGVAVTTDISDAIAISVPASLSLAEGESGSLVVTAASAVGADTTVSYTVTAGTAEEPADHDAVSGSVVISMSGTSASISITAAQDSLFEIAETFTVRLDSATSAADDVAVSSGAATTTVTIVEDVSDAIVVSLAGDGAVREGGTATYEVTLTGGTSTAGVMVPYVLSGGATPGADYTAPSGSLTIGIGDASGTISIMTADDGPGDDGEMLTVTLGQPTGGGGPGTSLTVDGTADSVTTMITEGISVSIGTPVRTTVGEGSTVMFPVTVSDRVPPGESITVSYMIDGGDASDYMGGLEGTIVILPADSIDGVSIEVLVLENPDVGEETFIVTLVAVTAGDATISSSKNSSPQVTIAALTVHLAGPGEVAEGEIAIYTVTLTGDTSTQNVMVPYVLTGTATDGGIDYTAPSPRSLTIPLGTSSGMISIETIDDAPTVDEGETLIVTLGTPTGGGVSVGVNDAAQETETVITEGDPEKALQYSLAGFMRSTASGTVEVIGDRFRARAAAGGASSFTLGGRDVSSLLSFEEGADTYQTLTGLAGRFGVDTPSGPLSMMGSAATDGLDLDIGGMGALASTAQSWLDLSEMSLQELLAQSSFEMSLDEGRGGAGPGSWGFWGRGGYSGFEGSPEDDFSMDGTVYSGMAGVDYQWNDLLVGLSVGHSNGEIDYEGAGGGEIEANLTSIHPYVQWSPDGKGESVVWGMLGFGWGDAEIMGRGETDLEMHMVSIGLRQEVYNTGEMDVSVNSDAFYVSSETDAADGVADAVDADTMRLRVAVEVGRTWEQAAGSSITTSLELGGRFDGGDAEEGAGAELGGEIGYENLPGGVDVSARGRYLVAHSESDFEEWAASVEVSLSPGGPGGRGLQFSLIPKWGSAASRVDSMWQGTSALESDGSARGSGSGSGLSPDSLDMEVGYGMSLRSRAGVLTPFGELGLADSDSRRARLGLRLGLLDGSGQETVRMELSGEHSARGNDTEPDQQVGLTGEFRF